MAPAASRVRPRAPTDISFVPDLIHAPSGGATSRRAPHHHGGRASLALTSLAAVAATLSTVGCGTGERSAPAPPRDTVVVVANPPRPPQSALDTSYRLRPGYVVDSVRPIAEELDAFQAGLPRPAALFGGAASREALVRRFLGALAHRDTTALAGMALTRAEFAWLVYPSSPFTRPPYRQSPGLVWVQLGQAGRPGLRRLAERLGGQPLAYIGHTCDPRPDREGENRLWRQCRVAYVRARRDTVRARLFGVIVERRGRFKFANFANDF